MQFPVSSGQQHRKGEEWQPVSPPQKKAEEKEKPVTPEISTPAATVPTSNIPLPLEAPPLPPELPDISVIEDPEPVTVPPPPNAPPGPQAFPTPMLEVFT